MRTLKRENSIARTKFFWYVTHPQPHQHRLQLSSVQGQNSAQVSTVSGFNLFFRSLAMRTIRPTTWVAEPGSLMLCVSSRVC